MKDARYLLACLILAGCSSLSRAERQAETHAAEGDAFLNQGRILAAVPIYEQVLQDLPGFPRAALQLGICWERLGMADRALQLYDGILKDAPQNPVAEHARARREKLLQLRDWDPSKGPQPREILD